MRHRSEMHLGQSSMEAFRTTDGHRHYAPDLRLYPVDGHIKLRCEVSTGTLAGKVIWRLRQGALSARTLKLNAVDFQILKVSSSQAQGFSYEYDGTCLSLEWLDEKSLDGETLSIEWSVVQPKAGLYFIGELPDRKRAPFRGMWTDHETERARYWLPCLDHPAVRTSITLEMNTDVDIIHLACGLNQSNEAGSFGRRSTWRLEQPCPAYLLCFAAGELAHHSFATENGLSLDVFGFEPTTSAELARSFDGTAGMMSWMTKRLGVDFPYPKYWQFVAPGIGGAMENISLTSWDQRFFGDEATHREFGGWVDIINLHEMAHSYFGDLVVIRDFAHAWLKEGWATYMESVWLTETVDLDTGHWLLQEDRLAYLDEVSSRYERPVITREFDHSWHMYDRHLYQGSAWRIHMLRCKLGEKDFWSATQDYLNQYGSKCAETDDFRRCLEDASGFHLSRFFEDWFRRPGCPKLTLSMDIEGTASREAVLSVVMDKPSDGGEYFELALDVALLDESGVWQTRSLAFKNGRASVSMGLQGKVEQVVLDPQGTQLFALSSSISPSVYAQTVTACPHVVGRVQAAQALVSNGNAMSVKALRNAYAQEPHFGVRRVLAKLVAHDKKGWQIQMLLDWLEIEQDPRVRFVIAHGLSGIRLTNSQTSIVRRIFASVEGQFLKGALLEILGTQEASQDLKLFVKNIKDNALPEPLRQSALSALGAQGTIEAYEYIASEYDALSTGPYLSGQRHRSLAKCARKLDRRYREKALSLLECVSREVVGAEALALADACVQLGEPAGTKILNHLLQGLDHQSSSNVKKLLSRLNAQKTQAQLSGRVDKLEARIRELEQALQVQMELKDSQSKG